PAHWSGAVGGSSGVWARVAARAAGVRSGGILGAGAVAVRVEGRRDAGGRVAGGERVVAPLVDELVDVFGCRVLRGRVLLVSECHTRRLPTSGSFHPPDPEQ